MQGQLWVGVELWSNLKIFAAISHDVQSVDNGPEHVKHEISHESHCEILISKNLQKILFLIFK
jgi:hypothetical protein